MIILTPFIFPGCLVQPPKCDYQWNSPTDFQLNWTKCLNVESTSFIKNWRILIFMIIINSPQHYFITTVPSEILHWSVSFKCCKILTFYALMGLGQFCPLLDFGNQVQKISSCPVQAHTYSILVFFSNLLIAEVWQPKLWEWEVSIWRFIVKFRINWKNPWL